MGQAEMLKFPYIQDDKLTQFLEETKEVRDKYPNLVPKEDEHSGEYFYKYVPMDVENLISELKSLNLGTSKNAKEMILINVGKYGYALQQDYILESLGFKLNSASRIKVKKEILKQADLFRVLYNSNIECYIRLRNKQTEETRAYPISILQDPYRLQAILKSNYFSNNNDMMYSLNCFNNMYRANESSLISLQNIGIDCDPDLEIISLDESLKLVKKEFNVTIPMPNVIEFGHRFRLLYSIEDVPATKKSIRTYNLVAKSIAKAFPGILNAKPQPAVTYARFEGSINSRNGAKIETIICNPFVFKLRELQKYVDIPVKEKVKKAINTGTNIINIPNYYGLNLGRLNDLEKIQSIRNIEYCRKTYKTEKEAMRMYKYYRELLSFLYRNYCVLSNQTHEEALENTIRFNEKFEIPMKLSKLITNTNNVKNKLYYYPTETLLEQLHIIPSEEVNLKMEKIVSEVESARRERIYQSEKYYENHEENKLRSKEKYYDKLREEGKMTKKEQLEELRVKIKSLRLQGFKNKDICIELNLPESTLKRHITHLKKNGLL